LDWNLNRLYDVLKDGDFTVDVIYDEMLNGGKEYTVFLRFAYQLKDGSYDYAGIPLKVFDTNDSDYNKGLAEELADKILEEF
jgi:hypothetical protein